LELWLAQPGVKRQKGNHNSKIAEIIGGFRVRRGGGALPGVAEWAAAAP
jgi:hypothetical protein